MFIIAMSYICYLKLIDLVGISKFKSFELRVIKASHQQRNNNLRKSLLNDQQQYLKNHLRL